MEAKECNSGEGRGIFSGNACLTFDFCWFCGSDWLKARDPTGMCLASKWPDAAAFHSSPPLSPPSLPFCHPSLSSLLLLAVGGGSFIFRADLCPVIETGLSNITYSQKSISHTHSFSQQINYWNGDFVDQKLATWLIYSIMQTTVGENVNIFKFHS